MAAAPTGNTTAIRLFKSSPVPRHAARRNAQSLGRDSFSSSALKNAHIASVIVKVNMTSGIKTRVKRNRPTQVAMQSPAYNPARRPKAHVPKAAVSHATPTADNANGIRADQSCTPKILYETTIGQ